MSNETIRKYLSDIDNLALQIETAKNIDYYVRKNVSEIAEYTKKQILAAAKRKKTAIDDNTIEIVTDDRTAEEIYNAVANDFRRILEKSREVYIFDTREYYYESPINIALRNKVIMYESALNGTSNKIALLMVEKEALERQISDLKQQVGDKTSENDHLNAQLYELRATLNGLRNELLDFEKDRKIKDAEIRKMTERLEELKKDFTEEYEDVIKRHDERVKKMTEQHKSSLQALGEFNEQIIGENKELSYEKADLQSRNQFLTDYNMTRTKENRELKQKNIKLDADNTELKKQIDTLLENSYNLIESTNNNKRTVVNELKKQLEKCQEELKTKPIDLTSVQNKIAEYKLLEKKCEEIQQENIHLSRTVIEHREKIAEQQSSIDRYGQARNANQAINVANNSRITEFNKINLENQKLRTELTQLHTSIAQLTTQLLEAKAKNQSIAKAEPIEEKPLHQQPVGYNPDDDTPLLVNFTSGIPMQNVKIVELLDELIKFLKTQNIAEASRQIDDLMVLIVDNKDVETKFKSNYKRLEMAIKQKDQEIALVKSEHDKTKQMLNSALGETMDARLFMVAAKKGGGEIKFLEFVNKFKTSYNLHFHEALFDVRQIIHDAKTITNVIDSFMELKDSNSFGNPANKIKFQQIFIELLDGLNVGGATKLQELIGNMSASIFSKRVNNFPAYGSAPKVSILYEEAFREIKSENPNTVRMACVVILVNSVVGTLKKHLPAVFDGSVIADKLFQLFKQPNADKSILIINLVKSGGAPTTESPMALAPILSVIAAPMISTTALIMTLAIAVIIFIFYVLYVIDTQSKIETPTRYIIEYRECQSQQ